MTASSIQRKRESETSTFSLHVCFTVIRGKDDQLKNVLRSLYGDVTLEEGVDDLVSDFFLQGVKTSEAVQCRVSTKPERTVDLPSLIQIDLKEEVCTLLSFE